MSSKTIINKFQIVLDYRSNCKENCYLVICLSAEKTYLVDLNADPLPPEIRHSKYQQKKEKVIA